MIKAQQLLRADVAGANSQPTDEDETPDELFDEGFDSPDDDDSFEHALYAPEPEEPVSDETHDRAVILITVLMAVGAMVLVLLLNLMTAAGLFGSVCTTHVRTAQCYSPAQEKNNPDYPGSIYPSHPYTITVP